MPGQLRPGPTDRRPARERGAVGNPRPGRDRFLLPAQALLADAELELDLAIVGPIGREPGQPGLRPGESPLRDLAAGLVAISPEPPLGKPSIEPEREQEPREAEGKQRKRRRRICSTPITTERESRARAAPRGGIALGWWSGYRGRGETARNAARVWPDRR